jgi:hypothetical protein
MTATIRRHISLLAIILVPMLADVIGPGRVMDRRDENFHQVVVVGEEFMSKDSLLKLFQTERRGDEVFIVSAFPNADAAASVISGKGHTETTYDYWKQQLNALKPHDSLRMMELISIGNDTVIRSVDKGRVSRTVIGPGNDPTFFEAAGQNCEILEMYFYRLPRPLQPGEGNPLIVSVCVRVASLPDEIGARLIVRELQRRLGQASINANISTDSWFIDSGQFPFQFPFEVEPKPPTLEEYGARVELFCQGSESTVVCHGIPPR